MKRKRKKTSGVGPRVFMDIKPGKRELEPVTFTLRLKDSEAEKLATELRAELDLAIERAKLVMTTNLEVRLFASLEEENATRKENEQLRQRITYLQGFIRELHDLLWKARSAR